MANNITYKWISDGQCIEISNEYLPDIGLSYSGYADLVNGRATVESYFAGSAVILTRNQDNTSAIGNLYIYAPATVPQVSFEIRSTNSSDNGTVYWQIVE